MIPAADINFDRDTFLAELYCICTEANDFRQLIQQVGPKIHRALSTDVLTYLDIETQTLYLDGRMVSIRERERIEIHAKRCLEGVDKTTSDGHGFSVVGLRPQDSDAHVPDETDLLWTGAVEREGRLLGVMTLYGQQRSLDHSAKQLMRATRGLIADGGHRLKQVSAVKDRTPEQSGVDVFVLTIDTSVSRGDITGLVMSKLQDAVAKRLANHIPDAFMVAKLGLNRLMVVGNPNQPLPLHEWERSCAQAIESLSTSSGLTIDFTITEGDLDRISESPICGLISKPSMPKDTRIHAAG
jgi:hypothetical protein